MLTSVAAVNQPSRLIFMTRLRYRETRRPLASMHPAHHAMEDREHHLNYAVTLMAKISPPGSRSSLVTWWRTWQWKIQVPSSSATNSMS